MKKQAFLVLIILLSFATAPLSIAQDFDKSTKWEQTAEQIKNLEAQLEKLKKQINPLPGASNIEINKKIINLDTKLQLFYQQLDQELHQQLFLDQRPAMLDGQKLEHMFPPYLQAVKVKNKKGEEIYHAYIKGPDEFKNKEMAAASYELFILQELHREIQNEIKDAEKSFIDVTEKYNKLLKEYSNGVRDKRLTDNIIKILIILAKSKGDVISLTAEAVEKQLALYQYLYLREYLGNDFKIDVPKYPDDLIQEIEKLKGDPVKWAEQQIYPGEYQDSGVFPEEKKKALLDYIETMANYYAKASKLAKPKHVAKYVLKHSETVNEMIAMFANKKILSEVKKSTRYNFLKGRVKSLSIDAISSTMLEMFNDTDEKYFDAAQVELEWFITRRHYHLAYAKLNALYEVMHEKLKEYNSAYKISPQQAEKRKLNIITDKILIDGDYTLSLKFNKDVRITELELGNSDQQYQHNLSKWEDFKKQLKDKYYPEIEPKDEKLFRSEYEIKFSYKKSSDKADYKDIVITVSASDLRGNRLDPDPLTIPLYYPQVEANPNYNPKLNKRLYSDIKDNWVFYDPPRYHEDSKHKLKQSIPIKVKATLEGEKSKIFKVR